MVTAAVAHGRAPRTGDCGRLFHALSDETRLAVLELLRGGNGVSAICRIVIGAAQSQLSFHLKVLKDAGLVADRKEGAGRTTRLPLSGLGRQQRR